MSKISSALHEIYSLDALSQRNLRMNRMHPLFKLLLTAVYIITLASFSRYDVAGTAIMAVYLLSIFLLSRLSLGACLRRLRLLLPFICIVGLANPFFDTSVITIGSTQISAGWLSLLTLMLKGCFAVLASYWLIATTSMEKICGALRQLHVPKLLVTQLLLTYRYITLLLQQAERISQAYALRAPRQKGIQFKVWGSLAGNLLLRSMDRACALYDSMSLRGYHGEFYYCGSTPKPSFRDVCLLLALLGLILLLKYLPAVILSGGVFA